MCNASGYSKGYDVSVYSESKTSDGWIESHLSGVFVDRPCKERYSGKYPELTATFWAHAAPKERKFVQWVRLRLSLVLDIMVIFVFFADPARF